ncbi:MAG: Hsp20/alpha crystallin family protein [Planctomycetota bacterium]
MFNLIPWKQKRKEDQRAPGALAESHPVARFREEMDALFDRFWGEWANGGDAWKGWPALSDRATDWAWDFDVDDRENEIVVRADAPGFEPEDFDVRVSAGHLIVQAQHEEKSEEENARHYRYGTLHRAFPLPEGVKEDQIEAKYHNGVLEIDVPKGEEAKGKRITVKT